MSDLIERKNAIEVLAWHMYDVALLKADGRLDTMDSYRKSAEIAMRHIPSADRPQGEWIETPNHTIRCSVCGAEFMDDIMGACLTSRLKHPRSCSVCTASMKGVDDE